ncbi:hypothetical protein K3Z87_27200 [Pseudomonas aeruginosa]|nr:hypothetical protein [Pseudomonas aeruginosa]
MAIKIPERFTQLFIRARYSAAPTARAISSGLFSTMPLPSDGHLSLSEVLADFPVNLLYRLAQEETP